MTATCLENSAFLVQSESIHGGQSELSSTADFSACMAQIGGVLGSGRKVFAIEHAGKRIAPSLLNAMIRLARHRAMLARLAIAFGLDTPDADGSFGHLLIKDALVVQSFLQGPLTPTPEGQ